MLSRTPKMAVLVVVAVLALWAPSPSIAVSGAAAEGNAAVAQISLYPNDDCTAHPWTTAHTVDECSFPPPPWAVNFHSIMVHIDPQTNKYSLSLYATEDCSGNIASLPMLGMGAKCYTGGPERRAYSVLSPYILPTTQVQMDAHAPTRQPRLGAAPLSNPRASITYSATLKSPDVLRRAYRGHQHQP